MFVAVTGPFGRINRRSARRGPLRLPLKPPQPHPPPRPPSKSVAAPTVAAPAVTTPPVTTAGSSTTLRWGSASTLSARRRPGSDETVARLGYPPAAASRGRRTTRAARAWTPREQAAHQAIRQGTAVRLHRRPPPLPSRGWDSSADQPAPPSWFDRLNQSVADRAVADPSRPSRRQADPAKAEPPKAEPFKAAAKTPTPQLATTRPPRRHRPQPPPTSTPTTMTGRPATRGSRTTRPTRPRPRPPSQRRQRRRRRRRRRRDGSGHTLSPRHGPRRRR